MIDEKERYTREAVIGEILALVRCPANDAMKLGFGEPPSAAEIDALDLRGLIELKRDEKGKTELKFIDRLRALEVLLAQMPDEEAQSGALLLRALAGTEEAE